MQEEVTRGAVTLIVDGAKLSEQVFEKAVKKFLEEIQKSQKPKIYRGRQSLKQLASQNAGLANIEISDKNIKAFSRVAKKYHVDFALKKDTAAEQPRYLVFFKSRDADAITAAFQEFASRKMSREEKLSDSRYATLDAQYEKEQSELTAEISVLEKAVKSYEKHEKDADRFIALIDKYENFDKLTIAMLNEFIEKILVHERDRKGSIQTTQEVEIYFNFVGRFVPPAFGEAELTPEELEEIRKREERKDRLHQNYLKRKASGAQKRYEDKIKKRKKAEIEAKKAAIRAEDIAKGVFVPVSSLPQREPMKGVQTA